MGGLSAKASICVSTANVDDPKRTIPHPERQTRRHVTHRQRQPVCDGGLAAVLPPVMDGTISKNGGGGGTCPVNACVLWMLEPLPLCPPHHVDCISDCGGTNVCSTSFFLIFQIKPLGQCGPGATWRTVSVMCSLIK